MPAAGDLRERLISEHHDTPGGAFAGHQGRERTFMAMRPRLYWPGMHADVQAYVRTCLSCQRSKARTRAPLGELQPLPPPERPWEVVTLDFITQLPESRHGSTQIVVASLRY